MLFSASVNRILKAGKKQLAMYACFRIVVSGKVQGVFFRKHARQHAEQLHITGYVKNLENGNVELVICGNPDDLKKMVTWCHHGPAGAVVESVQVNESGVQKFSAFEIKYF